MKRKRGHKKGKPKESPAVGANEAYLNVSGLNTEVSSGLVDFDSAEYGHGVEVDTPSSTGTDQPDKLANINPDGSVDKTLGQSAYACVKVKLRAQKMLESQPTSSDPPTQSDTDKSSQQMGLEKQGVVTEKMEDSANSLAEMKIAVSGTPLKKSGSITFKSSRGFGSLSINQTSNAVQEQGKRPYQEVSKTTHRYPRCNNEELSAALAVIKKVMRMDAAEPFNTPVNPIALGIPKGSDHLKNVRNKRASQTRLLQYKMIYEHAKGHLMRVKRERFLKRADLLTSGTKESQTLKNYFQHPFEPMAVDARLDVSHSHSLTINVEGKHEVACDKVVSLRKGVRVSEAKVEHLTNSFRTLCKMKGEPSCTDTIALVNDYLKKRTCCRLISQHLQLWEVEDVDRRDGHLNFVLNYHGFIFQRFTLNAGPASSIIISNKFNDMKIMNNFPNMDACTAFAFVLKAETTRKKVGPRSLAQETQITSSLVSNLLDVIGEVHLARTELKDLVKTRFHSPSVEQLDLELCLIEFRSGMKVILTLDMTCLNRGVYPSEILPSELQAPKSMLVEIKSAVESVRVGYSRILRLCRSVSHALLSHTFPISSSSASAY